ncbi:MAG TPA: YdeI/OmpD-associated family protein [Gemmatimonadaceae bacterium]|nr:YdeI/OmpD-associated family protein [Gemmatimonadaceae bacterium]
MAPAPDYPIRLFPDRAAFRKWLSGHHASEPGLWLRIAKAASPLKSVTYAEALDVALCFGWIDGQKKSYDADSFLQKFTPRRKRSAWSKRNREHVARLIAAGEMHAAGLAAVDAAKADGRWDRAYDSPGTAAVPDDLKAALDQHPDAKAFFETLKGANRYAILYRVQAAVKAETRARRIAEFVAMLQRKETLHP